MNTMKMKRIMKAIVMLALMALVVPRTAFADLAVAAGGALDIDGVILSVELGYAPEIGDRFLVIDKRSGTLTGRFSNYKAEATYNGRNYNLSVQQDTEGIALVSMPLSTMLLVR